MTTNNDSKLACDNEAGICTVNEPTLAIEKDIKEKHIQEKPKLIYFYDPLCGWCYGFSPVIKEIKKTYQGKIDVEVVCGGLFLGSSSGRVNDVAPHIKAGAYKSLEARTGVKVGKAFLDDIYGNGNIILDSLPPTIALCIVRKNLPNKELEFAESLLKAVYDDGMNSADLNNYAEYAAKIGMDKEKFRIEMQDSQYKVAAENEFAKFRSNPLSAMPSLVLEQNGRQTLLAKGYADFESLQVKLKSELI
jgi:putative protein-disulfide isomerase